MPSETFDEETLLFNVGAMIVRSDTVDSALMEKTAQLKIVVGACERYGNIALRGCEEMSVVARSTSARTPTPPRGYCLK